MDFNKASVRQCADLVGKGVLIGWARVGDLHAAGLVSNDDELNPLLIAQGFNPTTD